MKLDIAAIYRIHLTDGRKMKSKAEVVGSCRYISIYSEILESYSSNRSPVPSYFFVTSFQLFTREIK